MQNVDGEVFLRYLHDYLLKADEEKSLNKILLPLNPSCLSYLFTKFSDLNAGSQRSHNLRSISKIKVLTRSNLLDLQFFLENVTRLRIEPTIKDVFEDRTEIILTKCFPNLKELEIHKCKPTLILDLDELSMQLEKVVVVRSIDRVSELLLPKGAPPLEKRENSKRWGCLKELKLAHNYIVSLDESLTLLTAVENLDLSHNLLEKLENLQSFSNLLTLDLGYNRISLVENTVEFLGNLRVLVLRNNGLQSTRGIEKLTALERLDLSDNLLNSMEEVARISHLPYLDVLWLQGNPLAMFPTYRKDVFVLFAKENLLLDGQHPSSAERNAARSQAHYQGERAKPASPIAISTKPQPIPSAAASLPTLGESAMSQDRMASSASWKRSYIGSAKKKGKKRVASIEDTNTEIPPSSSADNGESDVIDALKDVSKHMSAISKFHDDNGTSWLVVYNEYKKRNEQQSEEQPSTSAKRQHARTKNKSLKSKGQQKDSSVKDATAKEGTTDNENLASSPSVATSEPKSEQASTKRTPMVISLPIQETHLFGDTTPSTLLKTPAQSTSEQTPQAQSLPSTPDQIIALGSSPSGSAPIDAEPSQTDQQTAASVSSSPPSSVASSPRISVGLLGTSPGQSRLSSPHSSSGRDSFPRVPDNNSSLSSSPRDGVNPINTPSAGPAMPTTEQRTALSASPMPANPLMTGQLEPTLSSSYVAQPQTSSVTFNDLDSNTTLSTEEFIVDVQTDANEWDPRILVVSSRYIDEGDTTSGTSVVRHETKHLTNVQETVKVEGDKKYRIIKLDFRSRAMDRTHHTVCIYRIENELEAQKFVKLMKDIVNSSTQRLQCMGCSGIYPLQDMDACPRCHSTFIVVVDQAESSAPPPSETLTVTPDVASIRPDEPSKGSEVAGSNAFVYKEDDDTIDANKRLYLRMTFFKKDDTSEAFLTYFKSLFIPYNESPTKETTVSIMVSSLYIYILQHKKRRTMLFTSLDDMSKYNDEELLAYHALTDLKRIVVGPFWQWFRIEVSSEEVYMFTTRSHKKVHAFIQLLKENRPRTGFIEIVNKNKEIVQNLAENVFNGVTPRLELYLWVLQRTKSSSFRQFGHLAKGGQSVPLTPRTLVVTPEELLLLDEDYSKWPSVNLPLIPRPKTPQFQVASRKPLSDLLQMELDSLAPNYVKMVFESDNKESDVWEIYTVGLLEQSAIVKNVSKLWQALFGVQLTITNSDNNVSM